MVGTDVPVIMNKRSTEQLHDIPTIALDQRGMSAIETSIVLIAFVGSWLGYPKLDALMGLGVAGLMLYSAYGIAIDAINDLLGNPLDRKTISEIQSIAMQVEGILNVHDIIVHSYGAHRFISLHIEIPEGESPESMHEMADKVEKLLIKQMDADVVTHVDPVTVAGEEFDKICKIISANMKAMEINTNIQDLRIVKNKAIESILFQVPVSIDFQEKDQFKIQCSLDLQQVYSDCKVMIEFKSQMTMR